MTTEILNCPACAGRGYRVKWNNGRGRTANCRTCNGTGKREVERKEPLLPKSGVHDPNCQLLCKNPGYDCRHSCSYCEAD